MSVLLAASFSFAAPMNSEIADLEVEALREEVEAEAQLVDAREAVQQMNKERAREADDKKRLRQKIAESSRLLRKATAERARAEKEIDRLLALQKDYDVQSQKLDQKMAQSRSEIESAQQKTENARNQRSELKEKKQALLRQTRELRSEVRTAQAEARQAIKEAKYARKQYQVALAKQKRIQKNLARAKAKARAQAARARAEVLKTQKATQKIQLTSLP